MLRITNYSATLLLFFFISSCAQIQQRSYQALQPDNLNSIIEISLSTEYDKALYIQRQNKVVLLNSDGNYFDIYRSGNFLRRVGKIGFGKENFTNLTDIALGQKDEIYALDNFKSEVKVFSPEGSLIHTIQVNDISDPYLIEFANINNIFIYDRGTNQIVSYNTGDNSISYSFGQMELINPVAMHRKQKRLHIHDSFRSSTFVYTHLGRFHKEFPGFIMEDNHRNIYNLEENYLTISQGKKFAISNTPWHYYSITENNIFILLSKTKILICEMTYETEQFKN